MFSIHVSFHVAGEQRRRRGRVVAFINAMVAIVIVDDELLPLQISDLKVLKK